MVFNMSAANKTDELERLPIDEFCKENNIYRATLAEALGITRQNLAGLAKRDIYVVEWDKESKARTVKLMRPRQKELVLHEGRLV